MTLLGLFSIGYLAWTLFEYLSHRYIAHWHERLCLHHVRPLDYRVGPSWWEIACLVAVFWTVCTLLGAFAFAAGCTVGLVTYLLVHFTLHHSGLYFWPLRTLRRNHNVHHFIDDHVNYGVSSPLWDVALRTYKGSKRK